MGLIRSSQQTLMGLSFTFLSLVFDNSRTQSERDMFYNEM